MVETFEIIHTNDYGKPSRFKTNPNSRDPVAEAINHINEKYFQNEKVKSAIHPDREDDAELFPAIGRTTQIFV